MTRFTLTALPLSARKKLFSLQHYFLNNCNEKCTSLLKTLQFSLLLFLSLTASAQLATYSFTGTGTCPNQNPDVISQPANAVFSSYTSTNTTCVSTNDIFNHQNWNTTNTID